MPALVLFGRRWKIASDDFFFPGLYDIISSVVWFTAAVIIFEKDEANLNCNEGYYVKVYFFSCFVNLPLMTAIEIWLIYTTTRGSLMDITARRFVSVILYLRLFVGLWAFVLNILGVIWFFFRKFGCEKAVASGKFITWFIMVHLINTFFFIMITSVLIFDPLGREYLKIQVMPLEEEPIFELPETRRSRYTEWRCKFWMHFLRLCCNVDLPVNDQAVIGVKEVAKIWTYVAGDYDLVPTDILAGLAGISTKHIGKEMQVHPITTDMVEFEAAMQNKSSNSLPLKFSLIEMDFRKSRDVLKFFQIYNYVGLTIPLHTGSNTKRQCNCWKTKCHRRPESNVVIEGDDCFGTRMRTLESYLHKFHIQESALIFVSFVNDYYRTPFLMAVEEHDPARSHGCKTFILSFRGYGSAMDLLTIVSAWPVPLDGIPDHPDFLVHHGALLAARNAKATLDRLGLLDLVRDPAGSYGLSHRLILTGHSLGAGIAVILGIILRKEFPNLRVYAYNAPGGMLNEPASIYTRDFVTSVIVGSDFIARLSIIAVEQLFEELVKEFRKSDQPKYLSQIQGCISACCPCLPIKCKCLTRKTRANRTQNDTVAQIDEEIELNWRPRKRIPVMEVPGLVLHIKPKNLDDIKSWTTDSTNTTVEVDPDNPKYKIDWILPSQLRRIEISEGMFKGHDPEDAKKALYEYIILSKIRKLKLLKRIRYGRMLESELENNIENPEEDPPPSPN